VTVNFIRQKFTIVAIGKLIRSVMSPVILILSINWLGVYAVLLAPLICTILTGLYYLRKGPIGYHFQFEWAEVVRLVKVGFIFSLSGIVFYMYRMADRTIIASLLPLRDLGLFAFAMSIIMVITNFFADIGRVLEPILWEHSARVENVSGAFSSTRRMAVYVALATAMVIPISQLGYSAIVQLLVPAYRDSMLVFLIVSNMIYLGTMSMIPAVILNSIVVKKAGLVTAILAIGVGINICLDVVVILAGHGIEAVGVVTVLSQGIVTCVLYYAARKYIVKRKGRYALFIGRATLPFMISILFSVFHGLFLGSAVLNPLLVGAVSMLCQVLLWCGVVQLFYRDYVTREKIAGIIKEAWRVGSSRIKKRTPRSQ